MSGFGKRGGASEPRPAFIPSEPIARPAAPVAMVTAPAPGSNAGFIALVVGVMLAASGAAFAVTSFTSAPSPAPAASAIAANPLAGYPGVERLYARIEQSYPDLYRDLARDTAGDVKRGDLEQAVRTVVARLDARLNAEGPAIEHADSASLGQILSTTANLLAAVQRVSPETCGRIGFSLMDDPKLIAGKDLVEAASWQTIAIIDAIASGKAKAATWPAPNAADNRALGDAVVALGVTLKEASAYQSSRNGSKMPPAERCALMVKMFRGMQATPEPSRSRVLAQAARDASRSRRSSPF